MFTVSVIMILFFIGTGVQSDVPTDLHSIAAKVNSLNLGWTAWVPPRFENHTLDDFKQLCGSIMKDDPGYFQLPERTPLPPIEVPSEFDARTHWPQCSSVIGHIRDQSKCGSCWAFGSTEAFNDRLCIKTSDTTLMSVADTNACSKGFGCSGGQPAEAWAWFVSDGVVTGGDYGESNGTTCKPYEFKPCAHHVSSKKYPPCPSEEYPTPKCVHACTEKGYKVPYASDKKKAKSSYAVGTNNPSAMQSEIYTHGPISTTFTVYQDFPAYKSGVYRPSPFVQPLGGHAVKIIGWGTEDSKPYWLVANSWNDDWGDNGFFKIYRGQDVCEIELHGCAGEV